MLRMSDHCAGNVDNTQNNKVNRIFFFFLNDLKQTNVGVMPRSELSKRVAKASGEVDNVQLLQGSMEKLKEFQIKFIFFKVRQSDRKS